MADERADKARAAPGPLTREEVEAIMAYGVHSIPHGMRAIRVIELCGLALKGMDAQRESRSATVARPTSGAYRWIKDASSALSELAATVRGESPRLLNEDSGGNSELSLKIDDLLSGVPCQNEDLGFDSPADRAARSSTAAPIEATCNWRSDDDGVWHTGCGQAWVFNDGGTPKDHKAHYCYHCGSKVVENRAENSDDAEFGMSEPVARSATAARPVPAPDRGFDTCMACRQQQECGALGKCLVTVDSRGAK